jgi:hypothetical protein
MDLEEFRHLYPASQLEDELLVPGAGGGGDVMWGLSYKRSQPKGRKSAAWVADQGRSPGR